MSLWCGVGTSSSAPGIFCPDEIGTATKDANKRGTVRYTLGSPIQIQKILDSKQAYVRFKYGLENRTK
jgi:hypothetical protein